MKLEFVNISKKYGSKVALEEVSFHLEPGVHGLLGPNGAGKTTLMNILTGLLKASGGKVVLDGRDTIAMGNEFREILGYLPQNPGFYSSFSGYEILDYFAELKGIADSKKKINELLELVNLKEDAKRKCGGYSGGMKRRLGIAVALLNEPKVLILDEPTAGLDPQERIRFRNIIGQIGLNRIVILATHIISDLENIADDIILLKEGKVLGIKTVEEFRAMAENKVWELEVSAEETEKYINANKCVHVLKSEGKIKLRLISDECPGNGAAAATPSMEDVYLSVFGEAAEE